MRLSGLATVEGNRAGLVGLRGDANDLALVLSMCRSSSSSRSVALSATAAASALGSSLRPRSRPSSSGCWCSPASTTESSGALTPGRLDDSALGRLDTWQSGVRKVAHNPLFGVGQFPENYRSYARKLVHWEARDAHNSFVKAAAEAGFVGFIPFMALVLSWRSCY